MNNYSVYVGKDNPKNPDGTVVYVGITMQAPERRFSWYKSNGKRLWFQVVATGLSQADAAAMEGCLIAEYLPTLNKRGMSLPKSHLTAEDLAARVGNRIWCQECFRRTVGKGYKMCLWCERLKRKANAEGSLEFTKAVAKECKDKGLTWKEATPLVWAAWVEKKLT